MINCLKCNEPLSILINLKEKIFACKKCNKKYELGIKKKIMTISSDKKSVRFLLNDISSCENQLSNNTVYDLYNKGYVKCTKTLKQEFNEFHSKWELPLNHVKNSVVQKLQNNISKLNSKLDSINSTQERYSCNSCNSVFDFSTSIKTNFTCRICSNFLKPYDNLKEKNMINSKITSINKNLLTLNRGWF